jgi:hypothetical protein
MEKDKAEITLTIKGHTIGENELSLSKELCEKVGLLNATIILEFAYARVNKIYKKVQETEQKAINEIEKGD